MRLMKTSQTEHMGTRHRDNSPRVCLPENPAVTATQIDAIRRDRGLVVSQ